MNKIWYPLKREYPEMDLKIWIERNVVNFSGKSTPKHLCNKGDIYANHGLRIASFSFANISAWGDTFYVGGNVNKGPFKTAKVYSEDELQRLIEKLNKCFPNIINLNKQTKVL